MGMDTGGSGGGPSSEINVTPLVDVCLVLLIIFMVMIPKNVPEISVRVPPDTKKKKPPKQQNDTLVIGLTKDNALTLNSQPISTRDELGDLIASRLQGREKKVVFIDFDDDANYGDAVELLDLAKRNGAAVLGIMKHKNRPVPDTLVGI
ncbi:Biopolymer transport protein ExbD [Enhygromyxa salina]|uniref:Biopolymer transport protein ExbD n=1 Tax=Enhygromyxa salina TaxID=215803 RepID=A0A2S9XAQ5_9BACT|nr:biopolymer transporter ExbD [Enhygromyxa salina]PRP89929.1 Biopolymer transport protein ExbD [Enhygromyxa salina]